MKEKKIEIASPTQNSANQATLSGHYPMPRAEQIPLLPESEGQAPEPPEFRQVLNLLKEVTSLPVISDYLRKMDVPHSAGSWEELEHKRLLPQLSMLPAATRVKRTILIR